MDQCPLQKHSMSIPLEQGLRRLTQWGFFPNKNSMSIPLEQGLRLGEQNYDDH